MSEKYSGSDWIAAQTKQQLSPLGKKVADILGQTFQGIYHLDEKMLHRVDWTSNDCIEIPLRKTLASYDNCDLTLLLVLCFDNMLRISIAPRTFSLLTIRFNKRDHRDGNIFERLPELNTLIDDLRKRYAIDSEKEN